MKITIISKTKNPNYYVVSVQETDGFRSEGKVRNDNTKLKVGAKLNMPDHFKRNVNGFWQ